MRFYRLFLFILILPLDVFCQDFNVEPQKQKMSCLLQKPLIFGGSISAGYQDIGDAAAAATKIKMSQLLGGNPQYLGRNPDPITRLAKQYHPTPQITNISEILNTMEHSSIGADQFLSYIQDPTQRQNALSSTVLASIDGLYWATIYGNDCSWSQYAIERTHEVIQFAKNNKIPLLLGNVPFEDESQVSPLIKEGWSLPDPRCVQMANSFLTRECRLNQQCYIIDLNRIVENLKGYLGPHDHAGITFQGKNYQYKEFREDGVHLYNHTESSIPHGMRYLMEYIEKSIAWNLPPCGA